MPGAPVPIASLRETRGSGRGPVMPAGRQCPLSVAGAGHRAEDGRGATTRAAARILPLGY